MFQLPHPDLLGCWPLGYFIDPDSDNDEESGKNFDDPTSTQDNEEED